MLKSVVAEVLVPPHLEGKVKGVVGKEVPVTVGEGIAEAKAEAKLVMAEGLLKTEKMER